VTVEVVQVADAPAGRRVVHRSDQPIRRIAYSPDGSRLALLDDQGTLAVVGTNTGSPAPTGQHVGTKRVYWTPKGIVTSSPDEVRIWPIPE
jgi:hypothetical protein